MPLLAISRSLTALVMAVAPFMMIAAQTADSAGSTIAPLSTRQTMQTTVDSTNYIPLTLQQKSELYVRRTYSLRAILGASYAAGLAQWHHIPREWGSGIRGYARRDAAAYGGGIVRRTADYGFAVLFREDPRYERSARSGFFPRTADVLRNSVTVRTDANGRRPAWTRAAAALVTGFAVNSWEPKRMHSTHHALMLSLAGFLSYGSAAFTQEFTPDVRRYVLRELHIGADSNTDAKE